MIKMNKKEQKKPQFFKLDKGKSIKITSLHDPRVEHYSPLNPSCKIIDHPKEIECPICKLLKEKEELS